MKWSYGLIREQLKDGSNALVLAEVYFDGKRQPRGCALVDWSELVVGKDTMRLVIRDIINQRKNNYFIRATDDGLKLGPRGRYSKTWLASHRGFKKGASTKKVK